MKKSSGNNYGAGKSDVMATKQSELKEGAIVKTAVAEARHQAANLPIDFGRRDSFPLPRARSSSLRRQSISLNAVINQRKALLGALFGGIGSNMSLPSCVAQDQDFSHVTENASNLVREKPEMNVETHVSHHRKMLQLAPVDTAASPLTCMDQVKVKDVKESGKRRRQHAELMSMISTLYMKLVVVVGIAIPVTSSVSQQVPPALDQGFYLYLYLASVGFVIAMCTTLLRDRAVKRMLVKYVDLEESLLPTKNIYDIAQTKVNFEGKFDFGVTDDKLKKKLILECKEANEKTSLQTHQTQQYGSFCLRLGMVGFGAGSLVFTGMQIGAEISSGIVGAITPATRLLLVIAQMSFIFLYSQNIELTKHGALAKLGLMHMIATNLCVWLQALVVETRHEIAQLEHADEGDDGILETLLTDASPFLFPCTIEFSLICAFILYEMWKRVDEPVIPKCESRLSHQLSIDCGSAHKGLLGGILVLSATVLSLIMFFVLKKAKPNLAIEQVTSLEIVILITGGLASSGAALKLRALKERKTTPPHLDATLLTAAQAGVYLHCLFGAVGGILSTGPTWGLSLTADFLALLQSTAQTLLIKIARRKRSTTSKKPGKELITFLIMVNISLWIVNTLEKSRADARPDHLRFYGVWAWTIITHVSMPLAIFYRFHSAICLFEVWKSCYKFRPHYCCIFEKTSRA